MVAVIGIKQEIFDSIIAKIGSLVTKLRSLTVSIGTEKLVPVRVKERIMEAIDILQVMTGMCRLGEREWKEMKKMTMVTPLGQAKLFQELEELESAEDRIIKIVRRLSAAVYSDRKTRDFLKTNHYDLYTDLKMFMFHCIKAMLELVREERELKVQIEGLEKRFEYNAEAAIKEFFPHIE